MAIKDKKPCATPWCGTLTANTYCTACQKKIDDQYEASRPSAAARGYNSRWRRESKAYLAHNKWCVHCLAAGLHVEAEHVDHIKPHKGSHKLFWDKNNWQALCKPCHSFKTAKQDGRFTRRRFIAILTAGLGGARLLKAQDENARKADLKARKQTKYCAANAICDNNGQDIGAEKMRISYGDILEMKRRLEAAKPNRAQYNRCLRAELQRKLKAAAGGACNL